MLALEEDASLVERLLVSALWDGSITAIARRASVGNVFQADVAIPTKQSWKFWTEEKSPIEFDFTQSRAVSPRAWYRPTRESAGQQFPKTEYFRVELLASDLLSLWPDIDVSRDDIVSTESNEIPAAKNKGGRKMKHNWPALTGAVVAYIVDNDYPDQQSTLVDFIQKWFVANNGVSPHSRDIERFVSEIYKTRRR